MRKLMPSGSVRPAIRGDHLGIPPAFVKRQEA